MPRDRSIPNLPTLNVTSDTVIDLPNGNYVFVTFDGDRVEFEVVSEHVFTCEGPVGQLDARDPVKAARIILTPRKRRNRVTKKDVPAAKLAARFKRALERDVNRNARRSRKGGR